MVEPALPTGMESEGLEPRPREAVSFRFFASVSSLLTGLWSGRLAVKTDRASSVAVEDV